jgi:hypothetical protein
MRVKKMEAQVPMKMIPGVPTKPLGGSCLNGVSAEQASSDSMLGMMGGAMYTVPSQQTKIHKADGLMHSGNQMLTISNTLAQLVRAYHSNVCAPCPATGSGVCFAPSPPIEPRSGCGVGLNCSECTHAQ